MKSRHTHTRTHTHTHTRLTALFPGLPEWASTRKVKPIWISLKQETVSGSGISWAICKSAPHSTPAPHHSVFLQAACPSCRPTNSVKALKALWQEVNATKIRWLSVSHYATLVHYFRWNQSILCIFASPVGALESCLPRAQFGVHCH